MSPHNSKQFVGLNRQAISSGVECGFYDPRHQMADLVKFRISEGGVVEMDDGAQGGAVTADDNVFPGILLQDGVQSGDVPVLDFLQAFAAREPIGKVCPLFLGKGREILHPDVVHPPLPEAVDGLNRKAVLVRKRLDGIHSPLVRAGQDSVDLLVRQKAGYKRPVCHALGRQLAGKIVVVIVIGLGRAWRTKNTCVITASL